MCAQNSLATKGTALNLEAGTGGAKRKSPTGACAKGRPLNTSIPYSSTPTTVPKEVLTSLVSFSGALLPANAKKKVEAETAMAAAIIVNVVFIKGLQ